MALAYLKGGPCDGETRQIDPSFDKGLEIICKESVYTASFPPVTHNGDLVFNYSGPLHPPPPGGTAAHFHSGWADLQRSFKHVMPVSLGNAKRSTQAGLRTVARARRVRL